MANSKIKDLGKPRTFSKDKTRLARLLRLLKYTRSTRHVLRENSIRETLSSQSASAIPANPSQMPVVVGSGVVPSVSTLRAIASSVKVWISSVAGKLVVLLLFPVFNIAGIVRGKHSPGMEDAEQNSKNMSTKKKKKTVKASRDIWSNVKGRLKALFRWGVRLLRFVISFRLKALVSALLLCDSMVAVSSYLLSCLLMAVVWVQSQFHTCSDVFGYFVPRLHELTLSRDHEYNFTETLLSPSPFQSPTKPGAFDGEESYFILAGIFWHGFILSGFSRNAILCLIQHLDAKVMFRVRKPFAFVRVGRVTLLASFSLCFDLSHSQSFIPRVTFLSLSFALSSRVSVSVGLSFSLSLVPILVISLA